jgi:hypothetical protein
MSSMELVRRLSGWEVGSDMWGGRYVGTYLTLEQISEREKTKEDKTRNDTIKTTLLNLFQYHKVSCRCGLEPEQILRDVFKRLKITLTDAESELLQE